MNDPAAAFDQAASLLGDYQRKGELPVLIKAIGLFRDVVAATPVGHPARAMCLSSLGAALQMRFERTGEEETLDEAIQVSRKAVAVSPDGDPARAMCLSVLGGLLQRRFERTGEEETLDEAIQLMRKTMEAVPDDGPSRAVGLNGLGLALQRRFELTGEEGALAEAIQVMRKAAEVSPDGDPNRAMLLGNLGVVLRIRVEQTGDEETLDEAIQVGRKAVAAAPVGHPNRVGCLSGLGNALRMRFERTGDEGALDEAIQITREAAEVAPDGDPNRAMLLGNLGVVLQRRFERTGDEGALAEAIQVMRDTVEAAPDSDPNRGIYLGNLGVVLRSWFERTGEEETLDEAIQVGREAVAVSPDGHPNRAMYLHNLGYVLQSWFERTGEEETLDEAIQVGREAVAVSPDGHPNRAMYLNSLGYALQSRFEQTGDDNALTEAVAFFQEAGGAITASAPIRIVGWHNAAAALTGKSGEDALAAAESAVRLLPQLTPRWLTRADREHQLGEVGSLAGAAAAAAIDAGQPERAVELLEQTRGVLVADLVDARSSDLTRLRAAVPELAEAFEELRARLDVPDQTVGISPVGLTAPDAEQARRETRHLADARREVQADWDELVTRIRSVNGFADFLAVPSIRDLAAQAHDGPIVFVTGGPTRCDALILARDLDIPVRLVPLTALTQAAAGEQADRLQEAWQNATDPLTDPMLRKAAQNEILEVLAWIWDTITEPVLTALGHTTAPTREESWPRVWWIPVDIMAYLPLQAAGHHSDLTADDPALRSNPRTVLDRVVSSYTTTVRGLAYARTRQPGNGKAVVVAVPDAPDIQPLPGVTAEATAIARLLPDALILNDPTRDTVLAALPGHQVAHFACHGYADWNDPASSRLILQDHHTVPLTVADISALYLTGGLAYLSACETAVTSPRLADEAVHITGAFHLAGYQHVIGTLWPVDDTSASNIAEDFYADLTADGTTPPQTTRSARALHHAIRRLRARYPLAPTLWAAHIHTGA